MKFSFSWLSSKERKELEELRKLKANLDQIPSGTVKTYSGPEPDTSVYEEHGTYKPYRSIRMINDQVIVVLHDGTTLMSDEGGIELLNQIKLAATDSEIRVLFMVLPNQDYKHDNVETEEERDQVRQNLRVIKECDEFEVKNDEIFIKGVDMPLPAMIVAEFIRILEQIEMFTGSEIENLEEEFEALKMFTLKIALNPIKSSREDAILFVKRNNIRITNLGNLVMYRGICSTGNRDKGLSKYVSTQYFKVKKWKKAPSNYDVWNDSSEYYAAPVGDVLENADLVGNLADLYNSLGDMQENTYTDAHTKKMKIKVGAVYSLPEDQVDIDSRNECSNGLHVGSRNFGIGSFGDTKVLCLVNPAKIRSVPYYDGNKMRVTEMFIAAVLEEKDGKYMDEDVDVISFDETYHNQSVEELTASLKASSFDYISQIYCQGEKSPLGKHDVQAITDMLAKKVDMI